MALIEFDVAGLKSQAHLIDNCVEVINKTCESITSEFEDMSGNWSGDVYTTKVVPQISSANESMNSIKASLTSISDGINTVSNNFSNIEG